MIATKKWYEAPSAQLIQFEKYDVITSSRPWEYDCSAHWQGNYKNDPDCDEDIYTDNSDA